MSSTPPRRPILVGPDYAKNLERGQGGSVAKLNPEETFVTAQRIFGGAHPFSFFMFLVDVRFACHFALRGRADSMLNGLLPLSRRFCSRRRLSNRTCP